MKTRNAQTNSCSHYSSSFHLGFRIENLLIKSGWEKFVVDLKTVVWISLFASGYFLVQLHTSKLASYIAN